MKAHQEDEEELKRLHQGKGDDYMKEIYDLKAQFNSLSKKHKHGKKHTSTVELDL